MLKDALKALQNFVFAENGDAEPDEVIIQKLNSLEREYEIKPEIDLHQYHNLFATLKVEIARKELRDQTKSVKSKKGTSKRSGKDWMPSERAILWFYINHAQEVENSTYGEAEEAVASILGKTKSGVRYKYYEMRGSVAKGEDIQTVLNQARKNQSTASSNETVEKPATPKRRGRPRKNPLPEEVAAKQVSDSSVTPVTSTKSTEVEQPKETVVEKPVASYETVVERTAPVEKNETVVRNSEEPVSENKLVTSPENRNAVSESEVIEKPRSAKSTVRVLQNIVSNFSVINDVYPNLDAKETLMDLLQGVELLSTMAIAQSHNADNQTELEKKVKNLEAELAQQKEASELLAKDYETLRKEHQNKGEELEKKLKNQTREIEDTFKTFTNTYKHHFSQDEDAQFLALDEFKKRMNVQIERMGSAINKTKQVSFTIPRNNSQYRINAKDGILQKLS